jgi:hypothetical protein
MTQAVATQHAATAPRERGWRWYVLAMVATLLVTAAPSWPPALALVAAAIRLALPLEQLAFVALVPLGACAIVGWWSGGRTSVALVAMLLVGWIVFKFPLPDSDYGTFVRGWSLALSAGFGLVCLASSNRPFLGRALAAVALATAVTGVGLSIQGRQGGAFSGTVQILESDYQRRLNESLADWKGRTESGAWQAFSTKLPQVASRAARVAEQLETLESSADLRANSAILLLSPALLVLESLLALALGWASYHRLARTRIGPPLGAIRELKFNDQLVWGLVVGAVLVALPNLSQLRVAGFNLLGFFGALYALRGVGVLSWWIPERAALALLLVLVVLVFVLGPFLVLTTLLAVCFGVGLSDTWRDFRSSRSVL